jgi:hypothetical protein
VRAAVLAVAVVTGAWFAVGALQARDTRRATAILASGGRLSPASARHTSSLLDGAGFLNPDRQVDVLRAQLDLGQGHELAARSILKRVVVSEPDNLQAWVWLARASVGDLKDFYAAAYRIRQLVPPARPLR